MDAYIECIICGNSKVENRSSGLCASCGAASRKAIANSRKLKIQHPIKKVSAKMAKDLEDYGVLRRKYLAEHEECEVRIEGVCDGQATTVHHCAKRGVNLLKPDTFKSACMPCHVYIETVMSAEERRERGLLISKNDTV